MLQIVLREEMNRRGLSSHTAAAEIGVSHTTILRTLRGDAVDVDTIVKFANWLGVRPSELLNSMSETALADQLAVLLSRSPELENVIRDGLGRVREGTLDAATLRDVVSYAAFKLQTSGEQDVRHRATQPASSRSRSEARSSKRTRNR